MRNVILIQAGRWLINAERLVLIEKLGSGGGIVHVNRTGNDIDRLELTADEMNELLKSLGIK